MERVRVGVIGTGAISAQYLGMAAKLPIVEIAAVADLNLEAAKKRAEEFKIPRVCSVDELFDDPSIEIILNLTIPSAHASVAIRALEAGKHTYAEKPFGINTIEGRQVLEVAKKKNLRVGCAPDTFMGAGIQTSRRLVDDGTIGKPVAFTAAMLSRGVEHWHPNPDFYYQPGAGPMFDMGPYYLTALLNLFGPVKRISGMASVTRPTREITSEPFKGKTIIVNTPDHVTGLMEFENGVVGSITQSFATRGGTYGASPIVVFGTEGSIHVPDPNAFDGEVRLNPFTDDKDPFKPTPMAFITGYGRSVGLADMAYAIRQDRPHRCSGEQAFAVLELMEGFLESSKSGKVFEPTLKYERPAPMPGLPPFGVL